MVSVGGNTVLDNSGGDNAVITLANESNVFTGTVTFTTDTGSDISIADTTAFDLGALAVNSLIVSAGGNISDSGVLDIGTTHLLPPLRQTEMLPWIRQVISTER